jgi:amyloid beta precursor protein binding protein 1
VWPPVLNHEPARLKMFVAVNHDAVIDTHPDHAYTLRIDQPFEQLEKYALGLDLDGMDSMEHSHVPYVVLLIRALKTFQVSSDPLT